MQYRFCVGTAENAFMLWASEKERIHTSIDCMVLGLSLATFKAESALQPPKASLQVRVWVMKEKALPTTAGLG